MTVTYENSFSDIIRFNLFHLPRTLLFWLMNGGIAVYAGWSAFSGLDGSEHSLLARVLTVVIMTSVLMSVVLSLQVVLIILSYRIRSNRSILTEHTVSLSPDGMDEVTPLGRQSSTWPGVLAIRENRRYFFFYTSQHAAHVIPKRAFEEPDAAVAFRDYALSHWQRAREAA